jgi:hypothetical protein
MRTRGISRITARRETFACATCATCMRGIDIPDNDERDGNAESIRAPRKVGSHDAAFQSCPLTRGSQRLERTRFGIPNRILNRILSTGSAVPKVARHRSRCGGYRGRAELWRSSCWRAAFHPRGTKRSPHGIRAMTWEGRKFHVVKNSR